APPVIEGSLDANEDIGVVEVSSAMDDVFDIGESNVESMEVRSKFSEFSKNKESVEEERRLKFKEEYGIPYPNPTTIPSSTLVVLLPSATATNTFFPLPPTTTLDITQHRSSAFGYPCRNNHLTKTVRTNIVYEPTLALPVMFRNHPCNHVDVLSHLYSDSHWLELDDWSNNDSI
ncbi:hypothetical protein Tco_1573472, partial [Tanacetum coccineum]